MGHSSIQNVVLSQALLPRLKTDFTLSQFSFLETDCRNVANSGKEDVLGEHFHETMK